MFAVARLAPRCTVGRATDSFELTDAKLNARLRQFAAFHCNQFRTTGILLGRLRSGSLLQTVGRLGIISSNHLFRAAVLAARQW